MLIKNITIPYSDYSQSIWRCSFVSSSRGKCKIVEALLGEGMKMKGEDVNYYSILQLLLSVPYSLRVPIKSGDYT